MLMSIYCVADVSIEVSMLTSCPQPVYTSRGDGWIVNNTFLVLWAMSQLTEFTGSSDEFLYWYVAPFFVGPIATYWTFNSNALK